MTNGEMMALVGMLSTFGVALVNMIGSVLMLYIRAKYKYPEQSAVVKEINGIRDIPDPKQGS